jgi:hypothetical protein
MLPVFTRFTIGDIPKAPEWVGYVFQKLNLFCEQTVATLNRNLTFGENVQGQKYTVTINTPADYATGGFSRVTLAYTGGGVPTCCIVGRVSGASTIITPVMVSDWSFNQNVNPGTVNIGYIAGLAASERYEISLLVV